MKKEKKVKLSKQEKQDQTWNAGFDAGLQIGMYEAIGILMFQADKHGNVAGIDDLIKLIREDIDKVVGNYGI